MTLLSLINEAIQKTTEQDPIGALLRRVKRRAYAIQTQQNVITEKALEMACKEEHLELSTPPEGESFPQSQDRLGLADYVGTTLLKRRPLMNDEQIRRVLIPYKHLPAKEQVQMIVRRYRGRVNPVDVQRVVKERH